MAQKLVRCIEGHVYDASSHEACPICGAAQSDDRKQGELTQTSVGPADKSPQRPPRSVLLAAAAALVLLLGAAAWSLGLFGSSQPAPVEIAKNGAQEEAAASRTAESSADLAPEKEKKPASESASVPPLPDIARVTDCDRYAMAPADLDRIPGADGVMNLRDIDSVVAIRACETAVQSTPNDRRLWVNLGRAYRAGKNDIAAATAYRRATEQGSMFGAYALGLMMRDGAGLQRDPIEARRQVRRAAEAGIVPAMVDYGRMVEAGFGGSQDMAEARRFYEQAVDRGYVPALNILGNFLLSEKSGQRDPRKALELFERAAKQGDADGIANIGFMYEQGAGVERNLGLAREKYMEAAKAGSTWSMRQLASLFIDGKLATLDPSEPQRWLKMAIDAGDSAALVQLGRAHRNGKFGGSADPITARQLFEKAAERGNAEGMNELGVLYHNGTGVPRDYFTARSWYEKAAQLGNVAATANLGVLYEFGNGANQDFSQAWRLFENAASRGNGFAMFHLGQMAEYGKGMKRDFNLAKNWYLKAGEAGYKDGLWRAVILIDRYGTNKNPAVLATLALQAAKQGSQDALQALLQSPDRNLSRELRTAIEAQLASEGAYSGPVRGRFDREFRESLQAYLRTNR